MITISAIKIGQPVIIENHSYEYHGQKTVKKSGIKKSVYLFKGVSTSVDKEFNVTNAPTFRMEQDILKMN